MQQKFKIFLTRLVRNRAFLLLWGSQIFSQIANHFLNFTLGVRIDRLTASTTAFSLLFVAIGLPALLFGPFAGVLCDRLDKRLLMMITNILRALLVLIFIFVETNSYLIFIFAFIISTVMQFFAPAETALIPALVSKRGLVLANSLFAFSFFSSLVLGYLGSSVVIANYAPKDFTPLYIIASILFFCAFLANALMQVDKHLTHRPVPHTSKISAMWEEMREGFAYAQDSFPVRVSLLHLMLISSLFTSITVITPALAREVFHVQLEDLAQTVLIANALGIGIIFPLMRPLANKIGKTHLIQTGFLISGLLLCSLVFIRLVPINPYNFLFGIVFFLGIMNMFVSVPAQTILQTTTSEEIRGRIFGILNMLLNSMAAFPVVIVGIFTDIFDVYAVTMVLGIFFLLYGIATVLVHKKI